MPRMPVPKISEVLIDANKDWATREITNLGRLAGGFADLLKTGIYYNAPFPFLTSSTNSYAGMGANVIKGIPFFIARSVIANRIATSISALGAAGAVIRLGIYADNGSVYPGALVLDAGTVAVDAGAGLKEIVINQALSRGLYWLAMLSNDGVVTVRSDPTTHMGFLGNRAADLQWTYDVYSGALAYGPLPANFPGGLGLTDSCHIAALRFSAVT